MALIGATFGIGFTFGPLLAGLAMIFLPGRPGVRRLCCLRHVVARLDPRDCEDARDSVRPNLAPRRNWLDIRGLFSTLKTPTVGRLVLTFFLATLGFAGFEGTLASS